jgi:hypothetical protein
MPTLRYLTIACVAIVMGCASPAERAARMQAEMDYMIQVYGPACEKLGYKRDDDKWRDCVLHLSSKMDQRNWSYPSTTTCVGQYGFLHCSTF